MHTIAKLPLRRGDSFQSISLSSTADCEALILVSGKGLLRKEISASVPEKIILRLDNTPNLHHSILGVDHSDHLVEIQCSVPYMSGWVDARSMEDGSFKIQFGNAIPPQRIYPDFRVEHVGPMIGDREATQEDIGQPVTYIPPHAEGSASHPDSERGTISSIKDGKVWVNFRGPNGQLCPAENLVWG